MQVFDYAIVGGGSSGCVLANRLSSDPARHVLLVEAGPDTPPDDVPESILADGYLPDYFHDNRYWTNLSAFRSPIGARTPTEVDAELTAHRYEQARVMGGGSSVNGQVALRGLPWDYDDWVTRGAKGWSYNECLPYFRLLERDMDFEGPAHGRSGPIPLRRTFPESWTAFANAFRHALESRDLPYADDCHTTHRDGCFPFPKNNIYGRRITTAIGYLDSITRRRSNLCIRAETMLEELQFNGRRVTGLKLRRKDGSSDTVLANEVILCAGALHTPAILMRAGIGPGDHLAKNEIEVRADRKGIGENLQDHPLVGIGLHLKKSARTVRLMNSFVIYSRFSSGLDDCPKGDMKMSLSDRFDQTKIGNQIGAIRVGPDKAYSRGQVLLKSPDANQEPYVSFNLLSDPRDLARMKQGVRFVISVLQSDEIKEVSNLVFAGAYTDWIRRLSNGNAVNRLLTKLGALALDSNSMIRQGIMRISMPSYNLENMKTDDREIERFIFDTVLGNWHACGTVAMGAETDPMACVDPSGKVIGIDGLRVVDASIMPCIPCANIHLTTIMVAEKIADEIRSNPRA